MKQQDNGRDQVCCVFGGPDFSVDFCKSSHPHPGGGPVWYPWRTLCRPLTRPPPRTHVSAGNLSVHSFFKNQDQPENSAQRFRGRASTFKDQISRGNASVLLTGVKVQDEGRYKCYTSTTSGNKESFINLKIDAPIHKLTIELAVKRITCRSEGIYPKPELTWSTSPPSNLTFKNTTTVQQTEQQLYNISSYLIPSSSDEDLEYSCTISTRRNREEVTVTNKFSLDEIKCRPPNIQISNLIWRFNFKEVILNGTVTNYTVSEKWKQHVKKLSESGSLTLQDISADQEGFYTCEVNDAEETTISLRYVESHKGAIVGGVIAAIVITVVVAAVGLVLYKHKREQQERRRRDNETHTNTELQPMTAPSSDASAPQ
ncbi:unnamed protein product [Oreochromis niloticus]|nr:unnamed protein product [Mustela putorius furo]